MKHILSANFLKAIKITLALLSIVTLQACSLAKMPILNPNGYVGQSEKDLLYFSVAIMALIVVPVIVGTWWIAWRYRESSNHNDYDPEFVHSSVLSKVTLYVPLLTIAVLGALNWVYTHRLDPYRPLGGDEKPYEVQAISMDFKWVFIYPEKGVATVNHLVVPSEKPVTIRVTSDPMMASIFIPGLLSQIYAMPGMETRANFLADKAGQFLGSNAMYSGPGFVHQWFKTQIVPEAEFNQWLDGVGDGKTISGGPEVTAEAELNMDRYKEMLKRNEDSYFKPVYFGSVDPKLFEEVVQKYRPAYKMNPLPTMNQYKGKSGLHENHAASGNDTGARGLMANADMENIASGRNN